MPHNEESEARNLVKTLMLGFSLGKPDLELIAAADYALVSARRAENEAIAQFVKERCKGEWVGVDDLVAAIRARMK